MQKRRGDEAQGAPAEVDLVVILHDFGLEGDVDLVPEEGACRLAGYHGSLRAVLQKLREGAGVVRFGVVHHDVVYARGIDQGTDLLDVLVEALGLDGVDDGYVALPLHEVGVVRGTVFGGKEIVEDGEARVLDPDPVETLP